MKNAIETEYARIRAEEREALRRRVSDAYARAPQLAELDVRRRGIILDAAARKIAPGESMAGLAAIAREERAVLASLGLKADTLQLRYRCPLCRDTGYVGEAPKAPCACRLKKRERLAGEAGINERETFASFSTEIYADEAQRKRTVNAKKLCEAYAASLPAPEKPNLLLMGMPGLGKTFLSNAIAYAAISNGVDAVRVTAYRFVQDMLSDIRDHTANARRYQSVPLFVLDDLGSEPEIPNVSTEWLFAVINERALANKATVCATNLSLAELQARYGERVMSRLCDRSTTTALRLTGSNLRTI